MARHLPHTVLAVVTGMILAPTLVASAAERVALHRLPPTQLAMPASPHDRDDAAAYLRVLGVSADGALRQLSSHTGASGMRHQRFEQVHRGIPVFGEHVLVATTASGALHRLSGVAVRGLDADVPEVVPRVAGEQAGRIARAVNLDGAVDTVISNERRRLMIHLDSQDTARLAWVVDFFADTSDGGSPTRPTTIIDAGNGDVLDRWEGLANERIGTGPGGNQKTGMREYGLDAPLLDVQVNGGTCSLQSTNVKTINLNHRVSGSVAHQYTCPRNSIKPINGAFAPMNDAHHFGDTVFQMYRDWLATAPLTFQLAMRVHYARNYENAFWNGSSMTFGDGLNTFYPLVALDVVAHEVSHGFTEQHSGLIYREQSGGINEAFSDIAGEAAEFFSSGHNDYLVGSTIFKRSGALRYMDDPTRDARSIGHARDYRPGMGVHFSSGVYNKAFYLLSNREGWDVRKAFLTFAEANRGYWTPSTNFATGACGISAAATDLGFDVTDVEAAFDAVGVHCDG